MYIQSDQPPSFSCLLTKKLKKNFKLLHFKCLCKCLNKSLVFSSGTKSKIFITWPFKKKLVDPVVEDKVQCGAIK